VAGTNTGVTAGTDLTGGGSSGKVTLNLDITKVPQLNTANNFTGNQAVTGNISAIGAISASGNVSVGKNVSGVSGSFSQTSNAPTLNLTNAAGGDGIDISTSGTGISVTGSASGFIAKSVNQAFTGTSTSGW